MIDAAKHAWKRWLLDRWVLFDELDTHTVSTYLRLVEALGIPPVAEVVSIAYQARRKPGSQSGSSE